MFNVDSPEFATGGENADQTFINTVSVMFDSFVIYHSQDAVPGIDIVFVAVDGCQETLKFVAIHDL